MANNRNNQPQDDNSLEAFLRADKDKRMKERLTDLETTKKSLEQQKDIIKNIKAIYTPVSKTQTLMVDFNKNQVNANRTLQSAIDKNTELLKQNVSNTKSLYSMLEKNFEKLSNSNATVQSKPSKKANDNFDNKAKHEQSILATEDSTVPILKSIKSDTAKIVKILEGNAKQEKEKVSQPKGSLFDGLPNSLKFLPWVLPLVAGVVAAQNKELGNGVKAGLGVATNAARLGVPILEAARAGATGASGLSKAAAAAAAAKAAMNAGTFRGAMTGSAPIGTLGKVGAGLGAGATIGRAMEGDTAGATAQGISTLLPLLLAKTKYGKMAGLASAGIDVGLLGRDYIKYADKKSEEESAADPVVQNTAETNKILEQIRDGGGLSLGTTASVAMPAIVAASAAILLKGKLGSGIATTGMGQRLMGGLSGAGRAGLGVAGKSVGKLIPGLGLAMGAYGAYGKIKEGDMMGALLEGGSGIASLFPGFGTAIAVGLQGMSATRDMMKASSDQTNEAVLKSTSETNAMITNSNNSVSSTILSNSELTNKNISSSAKTANDSLTQSANTLTSTGNTLAATLTGASNTLLGMIAKYSLPGAIAQGMQTVGGFFAGAPQANSLAQGHNNLHSSRKNNMMSVYNAMIKAGMSDNQARAMTAEVGRENSFGNNIWKSHRDDKNGKLNMGMMSWQGDRAEKLMKFMKAKGLVNPDGSLQRSQAAIDAQAEFMVHEMRTNYSGVGKKFLNNKNISYADASKILGKDYIQWAYDNPKYASGHANRDGFYTDLNNEIHKRGGTKQQSIKYVSQKEMDKLSKAEARPPMMASAKVQAEWKKREDARIKKHSEISKGVIAGTHKIGTAPKTETSKGAIPYANPNTGAKDEGSTKSESISNKQYYNIGLQNVIVGSGVDMNGLTSECREAFYTMIGELFSTKAPNKKPVVSSAYRSPQKQQALWDAELKKQGGDEAKARKWVAKPGNSKHEKGLALDVDYKGGATVKLLEASGLLGKYNFSRPLSNEPWHIEYGSGSVGAAASALGSAVGDFLETPDFANASEAADAAIKFAAAGMSTMLSGGAMDSIRDFIKGGKIDAPKDKYGRPTAAGIFTQDESDPSRSLPKDIGNGVFWENLDQQLGNGTLQRQERDQAEYDKVKKAWEGKQGIFRQIGGKYGWLSEMFSGLFGEDNLLGNVFGVLTGEQDISGLPSVLGKSITGQNADLDRIGVLGGGFGGGLSSNNQGVYPLTYDDTFNRYEDQEFQRAKAVQKETEDQRRRIEVSMPPPIQTQTQQAPAGGKSSRQGLTGGTTITRNPDSIIQQVAIAMMRSSL